MHLYKMSEWQSGSGRWYVNDTSDLSGNAGKWWMPARMLGITPAAYIEVLVKNYKPDNVSFNGKTLIFSWNKDNYSKAHLFLLWINRESRKKGFKV